MVYNDFILIGSVGNGNPHCQQKQKSEQNDKIVSSDKKGS